MSATTAAAARNPGPNTETRRNALRSPIARYRLLLDEEDYSAREYEATLENIDIAGRFLQRKFELPKIGPAKSTGGLRTTSRARLRTATIKVAGRATTHSAKPARGSGTQ